ncbi:hypothetical protein GQF61_04460 [Sphingobacterium sp. DK4209]|uniref:FAD-dependent urate hydroxylase HpyO/Asp monooxygenase CreE-like FAD/NAD(P)-binding domain-containing protein n=1 Tax=Sphingobacterium zhuxiongii TaxID=2662364 RepID=A0A5Q0QAU8_9SPHI|nr:MULTISPECIES: FAD/NAD(P)-binding protein [unclassified Sphingobacterium]MVZ65093.1 hypothetical protein [Sphingobacterium sp. DK4209]QGA26041.1 hypothetical protein GFH32_06790 [Sphingobacterium sp. dk4302]
MIWDSSNLDSALLNLPNEIDSLICSVEQLEEYCENEPYIAIVGGGPKGFYALDSFLSRAKDYLKQPQFKDKKLNVHWYNDNRNFATGPHFNTDLPSYFLVNRCIAEITCWEQHEDEDQHSNKLNLIGWLQKYSNSSQEVKWDHLCTRELLGYYFLDACMSIIKEKHPQIIVHLLKEDIIDLDIEEDQFSLKAKAQDIPFHYDSILFATGHSYQNTSFSYLKSNQNAGYSIIDEIYPIDKLNEIPARAEVAVWGTGLTFLDAMLELTEGRGGIFYKKDEEYHYLSSGKEPIMFPFSRRSLPNLPGNPFSNTKKRKLTFLNDTWLSELIAENKKVDFLNEVIPLLDMEVKYAFYPLIPNFKEMDKEAVLNFLKDDKAEKYFSLNALMDPFSHSKLPSDSNFQEFVVDLSNYCMQMTEFGEFQSPMAAAIGALREGYEQIVKLYNEVGFTAESQKAFLDRWAPNINHLAYGPPREVSEKFFCLMREGYINFLFSEMPSVTQSGNSIRLKNKYIEKDFQFLLNARVPKGNLRLNNNSLFDRMLEKSIIKEWINDSYRTGAIELDEFGKPTGLNENLQLYFYGIPEEGQMVNKDNILRTQNNNAVSWAEQGLFEIQKRYVSGKERGAYDGQNFNLDSA